MARSHDTGVPNVTFEKMRTILAERTQENYLRKGISPPAGKYAVGLSCMEYHRGFFPGESLEVTRVACE